MLVVRAIHTFAAEHDDELDFAAGEEIEVLEKDDAFGDGWWRGRNTKGQEGLFPATYISTASPDAPAAEVANAQDAPRSPSPAAIPTALPPAAPPVDDDPPSPKTSPVPDDNKPLLDSAVETIGSAAASAATTASNVMGQTIGEIQTAIESIAKPESDDEELGIGSDARARLAEQAKLANEQRARQRESGAVAGLVYSDESDDEEDDPRQSLTAAVNGFSLNNGGLNGSTGSAGSGGLPVTAGLAGMAGIGAVGMGGMGGMGGVANGTYAEKAKTPSVHSSIRAARETELPPSLSSSTPEPRQSGEGALQPPLALVSTPPAGPVSTRDPATWSVDEVVAWAESKGFEESICAKFREHEISGDLLLELDANLIKELDIPQFGKRLRIAQAINQLRPTPSPSLAQRGMSAPPSALSATTPPLSTPPLSAPLDNGVSHSAWAPTSRRSSSTTGPVQPTMQAIKENQIHTPVTVPSSPATPSSSSLTKRESTGSMGHKRGKSSVDSKDRLSFFGRARKPAPTATSPGGPRGNVASTNRVHQMQPATPEHARKASGPIGNASALRQIGTPDHSGYMKKKGDQFANWKSRFFVLKGSHLYFMKNEHEDKVKGHIDLRGYRVIVDENTNPGSYGFRLVKGSEKPHSFSSSEQSAIREWMKALMKATIARDYNVPVTSSCNIPTIPLAEAQALAPRPPSPATRDATQRANRRENTNQLTAHDATVLMSLDPKRRASQNLALTPSRPSRDTRRPSSTFQRPLSSTTSNGGANGISARPDLVEWVNSRLPPQYPRASSIPQSFASGEVIFLLVRHLSGIEPSPAVPPDAFKPEGGLPGIAGLFAMMDIIIDAGIDTAGASINDIRQGDVESISRLLESIQQWSGQQGLAR